MKPLAILIFYAAVTWASAFGVPAQPSDDLVVSLPTARRKEDMNAQELTFSDFQTASFERAKHAFPPQCLEPGFLGIAIAGEAGELCNLVKKVLRGDFPIEERRNDILDELADVMTYCDLFMSVLGENTGARIAAKFEEVSARRGWTAKLASEVTACLAEPARAESSEEMVRELVEWIKKYGGHGVESGVSCCDFYNNKPCNCGLDSLLARNQKEKA